MSLNTNIWLKNNPKNKYESITLKQIWVQGIYCLFDEFWLSQAKYIIHGTVFSYFGRAFNKKCAKEQASAFAFLGFTNKTFKEFSKQEPKDPLLKVSAYSVWLQCPLCSLCTHYLKNGSLHFTCSELKDAKC